MQTEDKFLVTNIRRYLGSDNPKLGSQFDTRQAISGTDESHELVQLLRLL